MVVIVAAASQKNRQLFGAPNRSKTIRATNGSNIALHNVSSRLAQTRRDVANPKGSPNLNCLIHGHW